MWLLKLHFAISILCILTFVGVKAVFKEQVKNNGYSAEGDNKKKPSIWIIFFTPILNVLIILVLFVMITVKKEDLDELYEDKKNEHDK